MGELFAVCALLLLYTYLAYPLLMAARARLGRRPWRHDAAWRPCVSVVIAARDEAGVLAAKLESVLAQRWPRRLLEVLVVDDGSRDDTAAEARRFADRGVQLISLGAPSGKAAALDVGVAEAHGQLLVFTDARQPLDGEEALARLIAPLADPTVGAVSGELRIDPGGGGLGLYRRMDDAIRRSEAATGSAVGVTGALWAMRRALWTPLPAGLILDDLHQPLCVARAGLRVVVEPEARVRDLASPDPAREMGRRVRTLAGNLQLLRMLPWALSPVENPLWFRLVSHKLLRLVAPLALALLALSTVSLALRPEAGVVPWLALAGQVLVYGLALARIGDPDPASPVLLPSRLGATGIALRRGVAAAARVCRSFVLLHVAAARAVWCVALGRERRLWRDALPGAGRMHP